jgi:hypothetical protein
MNHSMQHSALALFLIATAVSSCKGDDADDDNGGAGSSSLPQTVLSNLPAVAGALGPSSPPERLGQQIDRAGRPAITAALIGTFNADTAARDAERDRYNASANGNASFVPDIEASLGILDSLDNACGNQLLYGTGDARPYLALARALNDDQLYVNSGAASSGSVYLGVEAEATGALGAGQGSTGGRIPGDDVIERSYSVLALGKLRGFDDGVPSDDVRHDPNTFPFIAPPR